MTKMKTNHDQKKVNQNNMEKNNEKELLNSLAKIMHDKITGMETRTFIILPIRKIDGIEVMVHIHLFKKNVIFFEIWDDEQYLDKDGDMVSRQLFDKNVCRQPDTAPPLTLDACKSVLEKIKSLLAEISFSRLHGRFLTREEKKQDFDFLFYQWLHQSKEKIEWKISECSVCLEATKTQYGCNHFLCVACFQKLEKKKCPLCRKPFDYDDDDDDE